MKKVFKSAIEEYQCSGCVSGCDISCFEKDYTAGIGCGKHRAGTFCLGVGSMFLGMPKGFNRLGQLSGMQPSIYATYTEGHYDMWNIPVWKYKNPIGHTFVRGIRPRKNEPFLDIFLEDCLEKIDCLLITQDDVNCMD